MALLNQKLCYVMATLCDRLLYFVLQEASTRWPKNFFTTLWFICRLIPLLSEESGAFFLGHPVQLCTVGTVVQLYGWCKESEDEQVGMLVWHGNEQQQ